MYENLTTQPRLHQILLELGITEEELAEKAGVPLVAINQFERSYKHVDLNLVRIAKALNLKVEDLFDIQEDAWDARKHVPG